MKQIMLACFVSALQASAVDDPGALRFFETDIRPMLAESCFDCHDSEKQKGNLRLDHISWMLRGGDNGPAVVAGKPEESLLIDVIKRLDPDFAMPPKKANALSKIQVEKFERWIALGAPWPKDRNVDVAEPTDQNGFTASDRAWWAVQPVKDPSLPALSDNWAKHPVDRFIARKLNQANLTPAPPASKAELVRRAYFDLHGLPPSPKQAKAFIDDARPDAFAHLVNRLLNSRRYGERWAQHWLDVVRYAETDGYRADAYRPDVWRYRDYVIAAFNKDKPYHQFVREQLAADEFAPDDPDTLIATAFLRLGIYEWNQRNARMQWDLIMTEMTNATAESFLGIGIGCAQCHDHKFDPILQKDHFAFQAFLNTVWWPENLPMGTRSQKKQYALKLEKWQQATQQIREELKSLKAGKKKSATHEVVKQFPEDIQAIYRKPSTERGAYEEQLAQLVQRQVDGKIREIEWPKVFQNSSNEYARYLSLTNDLSTFASLKPAPLATGFVTTDIKTQPATTYLSKRGDRQAIEPSFLTLLGQPAPAIHPTATTTGRRLALANWIASPKNPLSTRVIVNRIWQRHFGHGLVSTPNDFGTLGQPPSHPELLDWLTSRFVENGWSIKQLHRLIMSSAVYQQTAQREPSALIEKTDPANRLLWRFPPSRLDAEQVRDAMLAVSGELTHRAGGPSVESDTPHRSIFIKKRRNTPDALMGSFDAPAGFSSAARRTQTTTPTQSLLLVNGDWTLKRASAMARKLLKGKSHAGPSEVKRAYQLVYGRAPTKQEHVLATNFLNDPSLPQVVAKETPAKHPNETGLRPIDEAFHQVSEFKLGYSALWLQPGSQFEQLHLPDFRLDSDTITVEAIVMLDNIYPDGAVNTLASRWNGASGSPGWALGVTSEQSRYQPRNLIVQLVGTNVAGNTDYEVVASGLRVPLGKPVYLAASIVARNQGNVGGSVRFYFKDLSTPTTTLQQIEIPHSIARGIQEASTPLLVGGRAGRGHKWDGQIARISLHNRMLDPVQLPFRSPSSSNDFTFSPASGESPIAGASWVKRSTAAKSDRRGLQVMIDFCHALLNSNEFLYLH